MNNGERQRIADHIHDHFGQDLILVTLKLLNLRDNLPPQHTAAVVEIENILKELIHDTRALMRDLTEPALTEKSFKAALHQLLDEMQRKYGLVCLSEIGWSPRLVNEIQGELLRAVRELLINVIKHARATQAKVVVFRKAASLKIEVCDDGTGLNFKSAACSDLTLGKHGLSRARARLALIHGNLRVGRRPGGGVKAVITLSLEHMEKPYECKNSSHR